jgi:hypothetical protein
MGLMDKVKAQATQLAQQAQDTARDSKAKFDQSQANKRADALLSNLGAVVYAERTGRGGADSQAQIDKLVADISAHEAENGINLAQRADQGPVAGTAAAPATGPGEFLPGPGTQPPATFSDPGKPSFSGAGAAPSFSGAGAAPSFPGAGTTSSFPGSGTTTAFPDAGTTSSFPDAGAAPSSPDAGTTSSFPGSGTSTAFPDAGTATSFPDAGTTSSFPDAGAAPSSPDDGTASSFPDDGTASSFPDAGPPEG